MVPNLIIFHVILVLDKVKPVSIAIFFIYKWCGIFFRRYWHLDDNVYDNLIKVLLMLYADDTAIFSNDAQGFQKGLDCLHLYCNI